MYSTHNWLFHESEITGKWYAVKREDMFLLFNNLSNPKVLCSSSIKTLRELIQKTGGEIKKLTNG